MSKKKKNAENKVMSTVEHEILAGLHYLAEDESQAMRGYEEFEAKFGMYLKKSELNAIREFISEEKKHLKKLTKMIQKRDCIKPEEEHHESEPIVETTTETPRKVKKPQ